MLKIERVDTEDKAQVSRFVRIPYRLYANCPQWVPPLLIDANIMIKWAPKLGKAYNEVFKNNWVYYPLTPGEIDFHFTNADLTQVADTAVQMRRDLINLGGVPYKTHRVYGKHLDEYHQQEPST